MVVYIGIIRQQNILYYICFYAEKHTKHTLLFIWKTQYEFSFIYTIIHGTICSGRLSFLVVVGLFGTLSLYIDFQTSKLLYSVVSVLVFMYSTLSINI